MNDSITVRAASLENAPRIAQLHVTVFRESHGEGPPFALRLQQWQESLARQDHFCFVLEERTQALVGFARGTPHDDVDGLRFDGELNKIYVLREYQGRGLGRRLVCAVCSEFVKRGVQSMLLFGDAKSQSNGFYERLGAERLLSSEGEFHGGYGWHQLADLARQCGGQ